ncbi:MAG: virion core protein, T7 gp14 family [Casimicrobium sp.]
MCGPAAPFIAAAAALTSAAGTVYGGMAERAQGRYEQQVNNQNAALERRKIGDAQERGAIEQMRRYRESAAAIGRQRANAGALGLDADFGSIAAGQADTAMIAGEDVYTIGRNTTREIEGYDINAANYVSRGRAARSRGNAAFTGSLFSATSTILGGASQFGKARAR